jgi:phosphoglycerate dehydrogenase-like enzyme
MQILMSQAAYDRVKLDLQAYGDTVDFVTVSAPDAFQRQGQDLPTDQVKPDGVWLSLDAYASGQMGTLTGKILKDASTPKWVQTFNAGIDSPMFKSIIEKGVRLTKSNAQAVAIAEYVVGHAVSLILPIDQQRALQDARTWKSTPYREVSQTRWLLIGYGSIGHEIANRIKPFGVHLTVVRRSPAPDAAVDAVVGMDALPGLLPDADVVVLACALNDDTRNMADAAFFDAMKPGSILVNIGRGGLVDEDAMRVGLDADKPAHAVLDVFQTEPLPANHWIWDHPKIRVTAHTSNSGQGTAGRGDQLFLSNLKRFVAGEPLINEAAPHEVGL